LIQDLYTGLDHSCAAVAHPLAGSIILTGTTSQSTRTTSIAGARRRRGRKVSAQRWRCFKPVDLLPSRSQGLHCPYCQGSDMVWRRPAAAVPRSRC